MIREANRKDRMALTALSLQVWLDTYAIDGINTEISNHVLSLFTPEHFDRVMDDPGCRVLVCTEGAYLRGYALANLASRFEGDENGFEIEKLYVHTPFQGRGIGRSLLDEIRARYGSPFWLYTWVRNPSIAFYKRYGFRDIGRYDLVFDSGRVENRVLGFGREKG